MTTHFSYILVVLSILLYSINSLAKDIYVAKNGDDTSDGSFQSPYLTLSKAAQVAVAGDVVYIREGTYEEVLAPVNSGTENNPIVFQSYENEKVIISAMQDLSGWQLDQDNIYVTEGDWSKGGSLYFYGDKPGSGWTTWRAFITDNTDTRVMFELDKSPTWIRTFHAPADGGDFYLQGIREVLDYQNEWYFDSATNKLYVQLPNGEMPSDNQISMRKRVTAIDLSARSYIHIKNLAVFGGSIEITGGASYNHIYGVTSLYGNYTLGVVTGFASGNQSVNIRSDWQQFNTKHNVIEKSEIGFGSGTGIYDSGENTQILNSYIHDFNYLGNYDAIINARGGNHTKVLNNLITRGGRDAIQGFNDFAEYAYNDISRSNLIADDCGLFYTVGGPSNTEIHHNWLHDAYSSGSKSKAAGIYLDNDAEAFSVHHNVIWNTEWSSIQINWDGTDINIYNNTMWNGSAVMGAWHKEGTAFSNVNVWNNLSDSDEWEPQSDKQNNLTLASSPFVNVDDGDFRLRASSSPIDAGRVIDDITSDVIDGAPDAGAYELGGDNADWVAGIDWERKLGPTDLGCYGLPGENCVNPNEQEPAANFSEDQTADEGDTVTVSVVLSSLAINYPVVIPYTIAGSATSGEDHNAEHGEVEITSGTEGSFTFSIETDDIQNENEDIVITMGTLTNAIAGESDAHVVTITDTTPEPAPTPAPALTPTPEVDSPSSSGGSLGSILVFLGVILVIRKRFNTAF